MDIMKVLCIFILVRRIKRIGQGETLCAASVQFFGIVGIGGGDAINCVCTGAAFPRRGKIYQPRSGASGQDAAKR